MGLDAVHAIPPVPLALVEAGVFHDATRTDDGYRLTWDRQPWYRPFADSDGVFHLREGDRAWCFTAVFAPRGLATRIWHRWEHFDEASREWVESDRIPFQIVGGRDGGYRGYTRKRHLTPGRWRVRVETEGEREVGRTGFLVVPAVGEPDWQTRIAG